MCCVTKSEVDLRSLHVAYRKLFSSWQYGRRDGPSRTINREKFKLKGSERRGIHVKNKRHSGQGDISTHKVHINCCYLQVQQSFKFPVERKQKVKISRTVPRSDNCHFGGQTQQNKSTRSLCHSVHSIYRTVHNIQGQFAR